MKLNCATVNFFLTNDIAFVEECKGARAAFYHDKSSPLIAVAASNLISRYSSGGDIKHINAWRQIIQRFVDVYGAKVLLIPHVQESYSDDRVIATEIWRELKFDNRVTVLASELTASEYKGIISSCDMVLAERMHAAIAGFSSGVCTIPVSYSIKAQGITSQLYKSSEFNVSDVCISVDDLLDLEYSIPHIDKVWNERSRHAAILQAQRSENQRLAMLNLELLYDVLS